MEQSDIRICYRVVKNLLRKRKMIDTYFIMKYSFSPYQACQHGCKYCDGRAEKYYIEGDFERDIVVRSNAAAVLEKDCRRLREKGVVGIGSGVSDPYQPVESSEKLMVKCSEVLLKYSLPAFVMTKSTLVERDLRSWIDLHQKAGFTLMFSLTTLDDSIREIFEPKASSTMGRLDVLNRFKQLGCNTGVLAQPLMPMITDTSESMDHLFSNLSEIGIDFVLPAGLTLRPGRQKNLFMSLIKQRYSALYDEYHRLYSRNLPSGSPDSSYIGMKMREIELLLKKYNISTLVPHRVYKNQLHSYDEVYVLLNHLQILYLRQGKNINRLRSGLKNYHDWLVRQKVLLGRKRRLTGQTVDWQFREMCRARQLNEIIQNTKLSDFIYQVVIENGVFDYQTLKLVM